MKSSGAKAKDMIVALCAAVQERCIWTHYSLYETGLTNIAPQLLSVGLGKPKSELGLAPYSLGCRPAISV